MRIGHRFLVLTAPQIRTGHLSGDGARTDQSYLRYKIIKTTRVVSRQRSHLRPAFDLKHADGIGPADGVINIRTIRSQVRKIAFMVVIIANQADPILTPTHPSQPQLIYLSYSTIRL